MEGLLLISVGLFSAGCAAADFDWFMNNRRAALVTAIFGRQGARGFYILLGLAFMGGGVAFMVGG